MVNIYLSCYKTINKQYEAILKHESGVFEDVDIEEIHQMRVAARRIRAAIQSFKPCIDSKYLELITDDIKLFAKMLGAVRDLDVAIVYFEDYLLENPGNAGVKFLLEYYKKRRKFSLKKLLSFLSSKKYSKFKLNLKIFKNYLLNEANKSDSNYYNSGFYESFENIINKVFAYKDHEDLKKSENDLHDLRIAIKHLRYNLEFVALKNKESKRILKTLRNYQEKLGIINDCCVMDARVNKILKKEKLEEKQIKAIFEFLAYIDKMKSEEISNFDFPWDTLCIKTIKKLYLPDCYL